MNTYKIKEKVLIICNHNSVRSQITEGLLKSLYGEYYDVYSAGSDPTTVNPYAIKVLAEIGGDSKACPFFSGGKTYLHESFKDPAEVDGTDQEKTDAFRKTRDEIKVWIEKTFKV
jgi:arsenate reductase